MFERMTKTLNPNSTSKAKINAKLLQLAYIISEVQRFHNFKAITSC